ncbi:MAG TPA: VCBS repeat-containing protein [Ignavibacteria bacterium]|nr:VCBS repeat-containing protein [Ignavibacteria bacterium]HRF66618.1 VCBS repeat-containing protein [Ignavibacteria bacterium]HRJ04472.1 VCBS repeat-containing protein [Ignavibacteria bacterium]
MKKSIFAGFLMLVIFNFISVSLADFPLKTFSNDDIKKITGAYLEGKLDFENPVMVDVDKDGDFDALKFNDGKVSYYKNVGTNESPSFVLENENYETYSRTFFVEPKMPYPIFFADKDGDGDMDLFVIKDKKYDAASHSYEYKVTGAENSMDLSTGTLITIILVLVIVLLVLAIIR